MSNDTPDPFTLRIGICHRCQSHLPAAASHYCRLDRKPITEHAESADCPSGRYAWAGFGDFLAALFYRMGIVHAAKAFERWTGRSCGCNRRRKWLNRWLPWFGAK